MSRFTKKKKEDIGLSPYALVFRGQKKTEKTWLHAMDFDLDEVREYDVKSVEQLKGLKAVKISVGLISTACMMYLEWRNWLRISKFR